MSEYVVVVNDEEQYSLWPAAREIPAGWTAAGVRGTEDECVGHVERVWVDMRPRALRGGDDGIGPLPVGHAPVSESACVDDAGPSRPAAPRTEAERVMVEVLAAVLGRDTVGVHDDFFALGGDSVLAIHVVARAREAGWAINPRQVLTCRGPAELAAVAVPVAQAGTAEPDVEADGDPWQVVDTYPLSPAQAGMVFHTLFDPDGTEHVVQFVYAVDGDLDTGLLRRAWEHVVDRHPILRTTFAWDGLPEPVQRVHRHAPVELRELDWRDVPPSRLPARLDEHLAAERAGGVDLEHRPPHRLDLVSVAGGGHRMIWHGHHVLLDGWSARLVVEEVRATYRSLADGTRPALPEPVPFRRHVDALRDHDRRAAAAYWRKVLDGVRTPTQLSLPRPERAAGPEVETLFGRLSTGDTGNLRALARRHRLTVASVVHAAWGLLLSRHGGGRDVVFGTTVTGRSGGLPGVERIVGLLVTTLPVRVRVPLDAKVGDWLRGVHEQLVDLRAHEHCALVDVRRQSEVPAGQRLFDTVVVFEPTHRNLAGEGGVTFTPLRTEERTGYQLVLNVVPGDELAYRLDFRPGRIAPDAARRLTAHFAMLLTELAAPDARIGDLAPLPEAERALVVERFNDTAAEFPAHLCLHELFERQADRCPDAVAVRTGTGSVSYAELDVRANRLAHHLVDLGVGPESLVGICVERDLDMVVGLLAVLKAGAAYVPLDPGHPAERLARVLADTAAPVVLTQERLLGRVPRHGGRVICLDGAEDAARVATRPGGRVARTVSPENLAYVTYTSGSTGMPKGTLIRHRGIVNYVWWMANRFPLTGGDTVPQLAGLSFDVSAYELFWPWARGAAVLLTRPDGHRDPRYLVDTMVGENVTAAHVVPSMLRAVLPLLGERRLPLRWLLASAEALTMDVLEEWEKRCPDTELLNLYGVTEVSVDSTVWSCHSSAGLVSVGSPIANTRVYVLDAAGAPAPVGVVGEAHLAGAGVGRGYHGRPGLTASRFVPDPFGPPGERMYRTGDLVRWLPGGTLEFLGRLDHEVKIRGFRVDLGEVEAAVLTHPGLAHAVVVARADARGSRRLVAYVVANRAPAPTTAELRAHLHDRLPDYMVPAAFVVLDTIPLNPNGKVDRAALPEVGGAGQEPSFVAPRTSVEHILAGVWREVLGVPEVGVHDNFFDLGGDSVLSIRVMAAARRAGLALTPRQMFADPTIADLAVHARAEDGGEHR
ncbi:non-ribosomal peptide synthetase [Actinophytocola oryzae]|uniref:non-ribosomal peptide synthetase n=1 Tax=Actinophytocola oryzae TaxID=502181 RepID=UPI00141525D8|nr:non-ribosomal peptide synthetase [Actinophytocola oryzae]